MYEVSIFNTISIVYSVIYMLYKGFKFIWLETFDKNDKISRPYG